MLRALAVFGVLCLIAVGSLAVFLVGYGMGWTAGFAAVPEPERVEEPAEEPTVEPAAEAFALDPDYEYALDAYRYAILGPDKTRGQIRELPA